MVTLALLTAGEKPDSPTISKALEYLRGFGPNDLHSTYAISLQTMVFAAADPAKDQLRIAANVEWLEDAQIKPGDPQFWPGSWSYSESKRARPGDNSNTQYALLGLARRQRGRRPGETDVWELSRSYWERCQKRDGSWAYTPDSNNSDGEHDLRGSLQPDHLRAPAISGAGVPARRDDPELRQGGCQQQPAAGYRLAGQPLSGRPELRRRPAVEVLLSLWPGAAGRLAGIRFFGQHDWYRLGAEELVHEQNKLDGFWQGALSRRDRVLATSFALLFLAKGRAPVLINKLRHGPAGDWNNDPDDIRNIVDVVSRDWKTPADLAGRRSQHRQRSRTCSRPRSSSSTATRRPEFTALAPGRTSRSSSSKGASSSPRRAAAAANSTRASSS